VCVLACVCVCFCVNVCVYECFYLCGCASVWVCMLSMSLATLWMLTLNKLYNKMVCVFVRVCMCLHVVNGIGNAVGFDSKKMLYTLKDIVCV